MGLKSLARPLTQPARTLLDWAKMPLVAKRTWRLDRRGLPDADPGIDRSIDGAIAWLKLAQERSASADGGVARHYSLIDGWATSYPETTGYIIPTMLAYADWKGDEGASESARRMLDWLVAIQLPEGGFQGGKIDAVPVVPVTFNTGQILLGLASGASVFGDAYLKAMRRAADWLVDTQDDDGCWRRHPTPFAAPGEKVYETHVAWGLFEAHRVDPKCGYGDAGLRNVEWALRSQRGKRLVRELLFDGYDSTAHTHPWVCASRHPGSLPPWV